MSFTLSNGRLIDPESGTDKLADLRIEAGIVTEIAPPKSLAPGAQHIDATGKWVVPGLIDMHVHLREPGEEYKEDIASGSAAAAFGGFTTVVAMPNTRPVVDSAELVAYVQTRGAAVGLCRVLAAGAVTAGQQGKLLAPFGEMRHAGAVALTDDGHPVKDAALMRAALEYSRDYQLPVLTHAEDADLTRDCHMHEGAISTRLGIRGSPRIAEDVAVARDILLAEYTGGRLHVCHVSTAAAVDLIRQAKKRGVQVTGEATPHHFTLTDAAVEGFQTAAKMNPPLREESDRLAVIAGLKDGTLDAIATDHAPHSSLEKDVTFNAAACGVLGLQTALPLALDLWRAGHLDLLDLLHRLTAGPALALRLPSGRLATGAAADIAIIDPDARWKFTADTILSKSVNSPFLGRTLTGQVETTILGGKRVFQRPHPLGVK